MKTLPAARRIAIIALSTSAVLPAVAMGQATRTWVSGVGDDANPCSRTAPCKTFAGAISKTAASGEINVLDPGGFGAVTITKAITIRSNDVEAGVLVSGTNGIIINAPDTARVVLDGLDIEGVGTGLSGVKILQAGNVRINDSTIHQFTTAGVESTNTSFHGQLQIRNTHIFNNPGGNTPGANPAPGTTAAVLFNAAGSKQKLTVRNSTLDDNEGGVVIHGNGQGVAALVSNTEISDNDGTAVLADGPYVTVRIRNDDIFDNLTGLATLNAGQIISWGGNTVDNNITNGAPTSTVAPV